MGCLKFALFTLLPNTIFMLSLDTFYSGVSFYICLFSFSVQRPPSTIVNASIAYIAGFVAKAVEERRTCTFCPSLHQSDGSSPVLMGLISLKSRGGLTFPKPEFVMVLVTIKKAVDIALPHIKKSNVRQQLAELILPHLE